MHITMVKKINKDGKPCRKCADVLNRLQQSNQIDKISRIVIADESDADSEGMVLAKKYSIDTAPFFIVKDDQQRTRIYTIYSLFVKEVFAGQVSGREKVKEIMEQNPDIDFI